MIYANLRMFFFRKKLSTHSLLPSRLSENNSLYKIESGCNRDAPHYSEQLLMPQCWSQSYK